MKVNEHIAISTADVLLVPYDRRHVQTYHDWMEDEATRAATASDRLTLDEEYENQASWRAAPDKLTFILCKRKEGDSTSAQTPIVAGVDDAPARMVGDINLFLHPCDGDDEKQVLSTAVTAYTGEVDIMIARAEDRGRGLGRAAVAAFLHYILRPEHLTAILAEASVSASADNCSSSRRPLPVLRELVVKIQATNSASIRLFSRLDFQQRGDVNYFGEVELVCRNMGDEDGTPLPSVRGYTERSYARA